MEEGELTKEKRSEVMARIYGMDEEDRPSHFTPDLILKKLKDNEKIIHELQSIEVQVNNKSIYLSGEKALYISNYGSIFYYDPSIRIGDKVTIAKFPIELTLNDTNIVMAANNRDSINFQYTFLVNEFMNLYSKIDISNLKSINKKDYISVDNARFSVCNVEVLEDRIVISDSGAVDSVPFKYIESLEQRNNLLIFKGCFLSKKNKKVYREIKLFIESERAVNACLKEYFGITKTNALIFSKMPFTYISFTGEINNAYYHKEDVMVSVQNDLALLINYNTLQPLGGFKIETMNYFKEGDKLFFTTDNLVILLELHEENNFSLNRSKLIKEDANLNIGYDSDGNPFLVRFEAEGLVLRQSDNRYLENIKLSDIGNISVERIFNEEDRFSKISISQRNSKRLELYISELYAPQLIKSIYKSLKGKQYDNLSVMGLFTNWGRLINDILNYFYFGSLFMLKEELSDVLEKGTEELCQEDKVKTANILYYAIQDQKKQFEMVSAYFPKLLEKQEKKLMAKVGGAIKGKQYTLLQRQLLSVSSQISNSLISIERNLEQILFVIVPNTKRKNAAVSSKYRKPGIISGVGSAGEMFAGTLAVPELITLDSGSDNPFKIDKAVEEIEKRKLDIYVSEALNSFEHLINVMMPYYINEVNEFVYNTFKVTSKSYSNLLNSQEVKRSLFERICDLYTFKQLPINEHLVKSKSQLIDEIHSTITLSELFVDKSVLAEENNPMN